MKHSVGYNEHTMAVSGMGMEMEMGMGMEMEMGMGMVIHK